MTRVEGGYRKIRVFVASPADVSAERDILAGVINELNITIAALIPDSKVVIELVRWETHATPAMGRPQGVINEQIGVFDIFVGIMWKRFGTPTGEAQGGTEEEFRLALTRWAARSQPHIMFYFSSARSAPPTTSDEVEQLSKVVGFREELSKKALVWSYADAGRFAEVVRPHLTSTIGQMIRAIPAELHTEPAAARERLQLQIVEIAPEDAYYAARDQLVGKMVVPHSLTITGDGWSGGLMEFDKPPLENEGRRISLFRFRWLAPL